MSYGIPHRHRDLVSRVHDLRHHTRQKSRDTGSTKNGTTAAHGGTTIHGVTKANDNDGSDRQRIIRQCCGSGDALFFLREPQNPVDRNAIQVRRVVYTDVPDKPRLGEQVGYLSRDLAEEFAARMDNDGWVMMGAILNISGEEFGENLGVNIEIAVYRPAPSQPPPKKRRARRKANAEAQPQI